MGGMVTRKYSWFSSSLDSTYSTSVLVSKISTAESEPQEKLGIQMGWVDTMADLRLLEALPGL